MTVATLTVVRRGPAFWLSAYRSMLAYEFAGQRMFVSQTAFFQTLIGAGVAIQYGFFLGHFPHRIAEFVVTGAPTLALLPVGLVLLPNLVSQQRLSGSYDFTWSLPVPRSAAVAAMLTLFGAMAVPGAALTEALAAWRYHVGLSPSLMLVPAIVLVALMTASVGYGMAHVISSPIVTNLIGNVMIFVVILFTPIAFPASQYPGWLVRVHDWLPLYPMARVMRSALIPGLAGDVGPAYAVLAGWTVLAWVGVAWVVGRRH